MQTKQNIFYSAIVLLLLSTACQYRIRFAYTPYVMLDERGKAVYQSLPSDQKKPEMDIFYVTDRLKEKDTAKGPLYGRKRSLALAYGEATVSIEPSLNWDDLVALSTCTERDQDFYLKVIDTRELGQLSPMSERFAVIDGSLSLPLKAQQDFSAEAVNLKKAISERLKKAQRREVFLYLHGVDNSFDDSVTRLAQLWHFMGRVGVPIAYTWPAGEGGLFGYFYDRESGEFTILHLKQLLRVLSGIPELERLHIISHSRGTDVISTALRELNIECEAKGLRLRNEYKLATFVMAAPDLDGEVFVQRFGCEGMFNIAERLVLYYSSGDSALSWALWLFDSRRRLGYQTLKDFTERQKQLLAQYPTVQVIDCEVSGFSNSHAYVFDDPAAMSDLILLLRDRCAPGEKSGRPLKSTIPGLWSLTSDYLRPKID